MPENAAELRLSTWGGTIGRLSSGCGNNSGLKNVPGADPPGGQLVPAPLPFSPAGPPWSGYLGGGAGTDKPGDVALFYQSSTRGSA